RNSWISSRKDSSFSCSPSRARSKRPSARSPAPAGRQGTTTPSSGSPGAAGAARTEESGSPGGELAQDQGERGGRLGRLSRLGRQRDFSLVRFRKELALAARDGERREILRQLLTDWTGLPHGREAEERWREIEKTFEAFKGAVGGPVSLQTVLLHHYHTRKGLLKEPRLLSERDLAVLRVNAITDPLTGLYNRRFLLDHLAREISRAERTHGIVSVLLTDLKNFKGINDH